MRCPTQLINLYINAASEAQGKLQEREYNDLKSQGTRILQPWTLNIQLPEQDLHDRSSSWHANVSGTHQLTRLHL